MTTPEKNMAPSIDEVEDLTLFADESFDTDEVDLFEFTGDDESPLARLKSIVLSLDWEISEEILNELVQEVTSLQSIWEGDKVAQVYLQGLEKVGNYLRREGANAHQNAIKLLFTLYYNYEKIVSSPDISGETITSLLKSDIRKFKVLQFQIGKIEPSPAGSAKQEISTTKEEEIEEPENEPLTNLEATILGLEWEVTDEGLSQFNKQADELSEQLIDNKPAEVLLQGLQAIGAYISEEKVNAHPDAYTLLHSFYEGLKILVSDEDIDNEKRQEILIDRISRLNSLKEIIADADTIESVDRPVDEVDKILDFATDDKVVEDQPTGEQGIEEEMGEVAFHSGDDELDFDQEEQKTTDQINAAMETADEQYPDDILDPDAIQPVSDEIADDFIEEELKLSSDFTPDLDKTPEEMVELSVEDESLSKEDLEEELELLFSDDKGDDAELEGLELSLDDEKNGNDVSGDLTPDLEVALEDVDQKGDDSLDFDEDLFLAEEDKDMVPADSDDLVMPALSESGEEGGFREEAESAGLAEEPSAELEEKLDSFFGSSVKEQDTDLTPEAQEEELSDRDTEGDSVASALADADDEGGFREEEVAAELEEDSTDDLQDKLDSFFSSDDEPETEEAAVLESEAGAEEPLEEEVDSFFSEDETSEDETFDVEQGLADTEPALADADETSGFDEQETVASLGDSTTEDIDDKLDSFFDEDKEERVSITPAPSTAIASLAAVTAALSPSPAPDDLKQVAELVAAGKEETIDASQSVLLSLIDSAVALLSKNPEAGAENNTIVQELVAGLEDAENPATLTETVQRYTSWQQDFFDQIVRNQKSTETTTPSPPVEEVDDDVTHQVQKGFSQLRETMMKEFEDIRKELKQE